MVDNDKVRVGTGETVHRTKEDNAKPLVWSLPSTLDTPEPPDGWHYLWVRHELRGDEDNSNVYGRVREGYTPVMYDEIQDFSMDKVDSGKHAGVVKSGDLILMKCPVEIMQQRRAYFDNKAKQLEQSVNDELYRNNSAAGPISREGESTITRGGSVERQVKIQ